MTTHHVEIRTDGMSGQVLIDGHDIAKSVTGLKFTTGIDQGVPMLSLDLMLIDVTTLCDAEAQVVLGYGVAEALKVLGWTPPKDSEG